MAVYRQIHISYWQDNFILKLTPEEKFFYLYLLTNSKTKQCGIYELPVKIIEIETGYNRETVLKLIQRFIDHKKIAYDWENEEIFILNWIKHNPFDNNKNVRKCVENELREVHNRAMIPLTSPLQALIQKEKEEEETKEEKEVGEKQTVQTLWISTYRQNPNPVKQKFGETLISKFGYERAKQILWTLSKNNFHSVAKMESVIDKDGNVNLNGNKPRPEATMSDDLKMIRAKMEEKNA